MSVITRHGELQALMTLMRENGCCSLSCCDDDGHAVSIALQLDYKPKALVATHDTTPPSVGLPIPPALAVLLEDDEEIDQKTKDELEAFERWQRGGPIPAGVSTDG